MAILFGIIVGLALGLTGGGGSILAVPLLIYGLGMTAKVAVSVSLAAVTLTAAVGAGDAARSRLLETRVALIFAAAGVLAAPLGVAAGGYVSDTCIELGFALLMLSVGARMAWRARREPAETGVVRAGLTALTGRTAAVRCAAIAMTAYCGSTCPVAPRLPVSG